MTKNSMQSALVFFFLVMLVTILACNNDESENMVSYESNIKLEYLSDSVLFICEIHKIVIRSSFFQNDSIYRTSIAANISVENNCSQKRTINLNNLMLYINGEKLGDINYFKSFGSRMISDTTLIHKQNINEELYWFIANRKILPIDIESIRIEYIKK